MNITPEIRTALRSKELFLEFNDAEFDELLELVDPLEAAAGEVIVRQDDEGDCMFLLAEGKATVVHHRDGRDVVLATLRTGDFFGELALVDCGVRSADVTAVTACSLLCLTQAALSALAGVYPRAAFKLLIAIGRILVARLRHSNRRYVDSLLFPIEKKE